MTSPSSLAPVGVPLEVPTGRPLGSPGEREQAEAALASKREQARAWLA